MVGFKKDNNKKSKLREAMGYLYIFIAGFIIAVFLTLYLVLHIVNVIRGNNEAPIEPSSSEPTSSEPISSSEESSEESSSSVDPYIEEKGIYQNLLDICKDYDNSVDKIVTINYDTDYLYITLTGDNYLYIYRGELLTDIELTLESLLTSGSSFEVTSEVDSSDISILSSEDLTSKSGFAYSDYTYNSKINYYTDSSHDQTALVTIGYKEDNYLSISYLRYIHSSESITDDDAYINTVSDTSTYYYSFLDYLYQLD